ncbi:glycosyltransferase family 4 protein [Draconibacterium sp. IB214405]|uniref:glycosyltransferase family 4 protein n=1 Tax=Draconibacterium sp. IB214405 TaxID=3097352 RepID=UPI002A0E28EF|nr:glycosyltransferase family 4 protein [Draconibacterium sp. IB214405]MDX8337594.1 glycosyltransferase family 4 protein [Draconibacterium sp. IB214405]
MKVLMFGWEFPPHISGGLGTACYGLTKGMSEIDDIDVTFVVPKAFGDEDQERMKLIGANTIPVNRKTVHFDSESKTMEYLEVDSPILPYVTEEEFWQLKSGRYSSQTKFIETDDHSKINFSGGYGPDLLKEIREYALVAQLIAEDTTCDIIHAHDWLTYPAGIAAREISGKPLVIHVHATEFDRSGGDVNPKVYAIEREGMEAADKIITVSNLTRNIVIEKYGINPVKVVTVYNAVESIENEKGSLPPKGVNDKVVTFLGRITMQKGPGYFIEAANLVLKKMQNARFVMAGSGDMMNEMIARTAELGIADRFHFTGFLKGNDVNDLFNMTDVFVMPSVSEPFGIVPLEAMQLNVPVIISKQSGVAEILKHAIKIDFWDTYAMADAIYGVLNYTSLSEHFQNEGKSEVNALKWIHSANEVRKVYMETLQKN